MATLVKTISVNQTVLHYVEQGSGEPVVLVHGSVSDYRNWQPQMDALAQRLHVIAYSRRYHYPDSWQAGSSDYSVGLHADDLAAFIDALGIRPAYIVGTSFGAYTTLLAVHRHPNLARKLVLCEPPILPWLPRLPGGQPLYDAFLRDAWNPAKAAFERGESEEGVKLFINGVSGGPVFDRLPSQVRDMQLDNASSLEAETRSPSYFTPFTPENAGQIDTPTLLLTGERSPRMFHLVVDELERHMPNTRRAEIPNASHSMASSNPQAFNKIVLDFLAP